jgi:hypothetical protein
MRVPTLSLLALISLSGQAANAAQATLPVPMRQYAVPGCDLVISAPTSWAASGETGGAALTLRSPPDRAPAPSPDGAAARERARGGVAVVVQPLTAEETPAAFAQRCRRDLERLGTNVAVSEEVETTLGGRTWFRLRYTFTTGQYAWEQVLHAAVIDDVGVCVTCGSDTADFARWQPAFNGIVASLGRSRPRLEAP